MQACLQNLKKENKTTLFMAKATHNHLLQDFTIHEIKERMNH